MILAYHRVNPQHKKDALTVLPENLKIQTNYLLKRDFNPVSLGVHAGEKLYGKGQRMFCATFDDGFADNLWHAFPILNALGVRPLIFLTAGYIGTSKTLPRYRQNTQYDRFLTWPEIKNMVEEGAEFGSHALTHSRLAALKKAQMESEVFSSKKMIEDRTGKEVSFFCYPYGDFNNKVIEAVQKAGYKGAVVTKGEKKIEASQYTIPRTGIYGHNSFLAFRIKIWRDYLTGKYF